MLQPLGISAEAEAVYVALGPLPSASVAELARLTSLQRVFGNPGMTIYRVLSNGGVHRGPDPADYPGYDCRRGGIAT